MPASNQGSRGALIMWTVVSSIVSIVAIILAIYFYVDKSHMDERLNALTTKYGKVLTEDMLRGDEMSNLEAAKNDQSRGFNPSMKLWDVLVAQRNNLAKLVDGNENEAAATTAGKAAIDKAKAAGAQLSGEPSLAAAIVALATRVDALKTEAENNKNDSAASKQKLDQTLASTEQQIKTMNDAMDKLRAERDEAMQLAQKTGQDQTTAFGSTAEEMRKQLAAAQDQISLLNTQNADQAAEIDKLKIQIKQLMEQLGTNRVDVAKMMTRQPDGKVLRVPTQDRVFIDLGAGDHVSPGLTFEIYDKLDGVPPAGDPSNDRALPIGKASIEVINVLATGSECRVIRKTYGTTVIEGDLIVNLVYDRHTRYNFVVYGNFDIDQNGTATPQDAEIIKRLITRWGGKVVDVINVDTDFVVLGREPIIPERPDPTDPLAVAEYEKALAASEAYDETSRKAREYRLPILNQNRFLYLTGYYTQSRR